MSTFVTNILDNVELNTHKKLLPVRAKTALGKRERKKNGIIIAKLFALDANAKIRKNYRLERD